MADEFLQVATHAPQPIQVAASNAASDAVDQATQAADTASNAADQVTQAADSASDAASDLAD